MNDITKFFGDSSRGLTDLNPIASGLGMALGTPSATLPIPTPSGDYFLHRLRRRDADRRIDLRAYRAHRPDRHRLPFTTCQVLSELGLLIFSQAGADAGGRSSRRSRPARGSGSSCWAR